MNIQEYISSGILEGYVFGALDEQEMRKVECMALVHDEIREELRRIELAFERISQDTGIAPSEDLRARVLENIRAADDNEGASNVVPLRPMDGGATHGSSSSNMYKWLAAASIIGVLLMAGGMWKQGQDRDQLMAAMDEQRDRTEELEQRLTESENALGQSNDRLIAMQDDLEVMGSTRFTAVNLKGTDNAPTAGAKVYWSPEDSQVYLKVERMADLSAGKVYQLWALDNGNPVDAGTFEGNEQGLIRMKQIGAGQAFAVSVEDEGGAETPAMETLQVMGNVPTS